MSEGNEGRLPVHAFLKCLGVRFHVVGNILQAHLATDHAAAQFPKDKPQEGASGLGGRFGGALVFLGEFGMVEVTDFWKVSSRVGDVDRRAIRHELRGIGMVANCGDFSSPDQLDDMFADRLQGVAVQVLRVPVALAFAQDDPLERIQLVVVETRESNWPVKSSDCRKTKS